LLRSVPNVIGEGKHKYAKFMYYLPDPDDMQRNWYLDCPSNYGISKNICSNSYKMLKDHGDVTIKNSVRQHLMRKSYWFSLFLIKNDIQEEELNGLIKIMRYGKQIEGKFEEQAKANPVANKKSVIVYDPYYGKDLFLKIQEKHDDKNNRDITDYTSSYFMDTNALECPVTTLHPDGFKLEGAPSEENVKKTLEFLKANSPDLSKVAAKQEDWDKATEDKAIRTVQFVIANDSVFNKVYRSVYNKQFFTGNAGTETEKKEGDIQFSGTDDIKKEQPSSSMDTSKKEEVKEEQISTDNKEDVKEQSADNTKSTEPAASSMEELEKKVVETNVENKENAQQQKPADENSDIANEDIDFEKI
jgi:hypothetical protein